MPRKRAKPDGEQLELPPEMMPVGVPKRCKVCERSMDESGPLTDQGYCFECGLAVAKGAVLAMQKKHGPMYERWLASRGPKGRPPASKGVPDP